MINTHSIPPLLTILSFVALSAASIFKGRKTKVNTLFFLLCVMGALLYFDVWFSAIASSPRAALFVRRIDHFVLVYSLPLYIHFFHTYLGITSRRYLVPLVYGYSFVLMCFVPTSFYFDGLRAHGGGYFGNGKIAYLFLTIGALAVSGYVLVILALAIRKASSNVQKSKLKWVLLGFGMMGFMTGINCLPNLGLNVYPVGNFSFIPLILFTVAFLKHDVFDTGALIHKGLIYSVVTVITTALYAALILLVDWVFKDLRASHTYLFALTFFFLIALILGPLKDGVQKAIDRLFYKGKYDYRQTVTEVGRMIAAVRRTSEIGQRIAKTVVEAMLVEGCGLGVLAENGKNFSQFIIHDLTDARNGSFAHTPWAELVDIMHTQKKAITRAQLEEGGVQAARLAALADMQRFGVELVVPMIFKDRLNGLLLMGAKRAGDVFTREDLDLLETLAGQGALAVENARSYQMVEDLNVNLEEKVKNRTAALQRALAEKERTQEQLVRSESLAAIGQLVAGTAHEMNNPLASAASLVQSTIEDLSVWKPKDTLDEDLLDDLKFAHKELKRARDIVASLLGLSRQTQTYAEKVDLNTVIKDALRVLHSRYKERNIIIEENYDLKLPTTFGNFAHLGQVAINIIKNAIDAVKDDKGIVNLSTHFDETDDKIVFVCSDNGPGIAPDLRQDIYKPFFTTKPVGQGTGLGLYVCHEITQRHEGTLTLKDTSRGGASFSVRLPVDK
jgi:signal transduction histidine kinase